MTHQLETVKAEAVEALEQLKEMYQYSHLIRATLILRNPDNDAETIFITDDPDPEAALLIGMDPP